MVQRKKKKERTQRIQYTAGSWLSKKEDPEEDSRQRAVARCLKKIPNKTGDSAKGRCLNIPELGILSGGVEGRNVTMQNNQANSVQPIYTKENLVHPTIEKSLLMRSITLLILE